VGLDIGTSTGGFADCLLQHGAARVHAVDTGAGQIDWKLRTDARVVLHEHMNARYLTFEEIGELTDVITCDVSFISVTLLVPALAALLKPEGDWIILVKPQFEVGRELAGGKVVDTLEELLEGRLVPLEHELLVAEAPLAPQLVLAQLHARREREDEQRAEVGRRLPVQCRCAASRPRARPREGRDRGSARRSPAPRGAL